MMLRSTLVAALLAAVSPAQLDPCVEVFPATRTQPLVLRWNDSEMWGPRHIDFVPYSGGIAMVAMFDTTVYEPWCNRYLTLSPLFAHCPRLALETRAFWWWDFWPSAGDFMSTPLAIDIFRVPQGLVFFSPPTSAWVPTVSRHSSANPVTQPSYWAVLLTPQGGSW